MSSATHCNASYNTRGRGRRPSERIHAPKCVRSREIYFLAFECAQSHVCTFKSLMWRYSSIMAFDFFSTSSSVKVGFGREGGGVGALSRLTAEADKKKKKKKEEDKLNITPLRSVCTTHTISLLWGDIHLGDLCLEPCPGFLCLYFPGLCFLYLDFLCPCFPCPCCLSCWPRDARARLMHGRLRPAILC